MDMNWMDEVGISGTVPPLLYCFLQPMVLALASTMAPQFPLCEERVASLALALPGPLLESLVPPGWNSLAVALAIAPHCTSVVQWAGSLMVHPLWGCDLTASGCTCPGATRRSRHWWTQASPPAWHIAGPVVGLPCDQGALVAPIQVQPVAQGCELAHRPGAFPGRWLAFPATSAALVAPGWVQPVAGVATWPTGLAC